jgi:two-component system LytT family sensor kinase
MATDESTGNFEKLEFWALTALFVFCLPLYMYGDVGITIEYVTVFLALLYVDFRVVPQLSQSERLPKNVMSLVAVLIVITIISLNTHGRDGLWDVVDHSFVIALTIAGHLAIKRLALFIISKTETLRSFFIIPNRNGLIVLGLWMIITYWAFILHVPTEVRLAWVAVVPTGILLHGLAFHYFIPASLKWKYPLIAYFFKVGLFCLATGLAVAVTMVIVTESEDHGFTIGLFNGMVNLLFTAPALWLIYRWQSNRKEQIDALQGELGRSAANVDFLRSQINPHFLFNALNTIYGLAIQEKAERTSASVEKLGDMMRFMLSENTQERISLKRELEYLENYISLQKLRTDSNPGLNIQVAIQERLDPVARIAPMLLIPFVENAFKHGISLREPSYIKIFLELKNTTLYFDVHNSTHQKMENDPERDRNGIGLENVRQRLQHMYPGRHELLVRETSHDFYVHLRIELD